MNNINVQKLSKVIWLHPWLCLKSFWILWYCRFVPVPRWKNWSPYSTVQNGAQNSGLWWVSFWYFRWSVRKPSRYLLWRFYGTSSKAQLMERDVLTLETVSYRIQLCYNAVKLCLASAETGEILIECFICVKCCKRLSSFVVLSQPDLHRGAFLLVTPFRHV